MSRNQIRSKGVGKRLTSGLRPATEGCRNFLSEWGLTKIGPDTVHNRALGREVGIREMVRAVGARWPLPTDQLETQEGSMPQESVFELFQRQPGHVNRQLVRG